MDKKGNLMPYKNYKWLLKEYKITPYSKQYALGYIRALYDEDLISRDQWNYLIKIIEKYSTNR